MQKILFTILINLFLFSGIACSQTSEDPLTLGTFRITKVVDGDTFKFENMDGSSRLLGIDTEETFKTDDAERKTAEIEANWDEYYKFEKGDNKMPVKTNSPLGYEAMVWAQDYLKNVEFARLEKEDENRSLDIFGRYLVYMFIEKDGKQINYNVEIVRLGYSPYFNKYGNSKKYHNDFLEAQEYAMNNKLGIWDPEKKHYPDYEERIVWWNKRAEQLENFNSKYSGTENYFNLADDSDYKRLSENVGKEIVVFGNISDVLTKKFPYLLRIPHTKNETFEVVVFEENINILDEIDIDSKKDYYTYIKGTLKEYKGRYQIELTDKEQIWVE
ncbi:MAG TPA: thermonuclease family protein [Ignavibacteria bacterium]|nr:thermonuclease family protein [Ignavibacteria bacterium]